MIFSRKNESQPKRGDNRRIVSDMRPRKGSGARSQPLPPRIEGERPRTLPPHAPVPVRHEEKEFLKPRTREEEVMYTELPRRSRLPWYILAVTLLFFIGLGAYVVWASNLTLIVERKKTVFDLGSPGIKVTITAKAFTDSLAKRGDGVSKSAKKFNEKAGGIIVVYNAYSKDAQVLIAGTRFAAPEGLIFKAIARVVVPGRTTERPGSIDVLVAADEAGPKYNIGLTDFTIPGFAGGPKFEKFYGRSKTEMKGGATGEGKVVGKEEADLLLGQLEGEMKNELKQKFESSIPKEYVIFPSKFEYTTAARITDPSVGSPAEKFFGEVRGEARTLAVDPATYSDTLAAVLFKEKYQQGAVALHKSSSITFKNVTFDYTAGNVTAVLEGKVVFEWVLDVNNLKQKVMEAPDAASLSDAFFKSFPAVSRVEAVFKPRFWRRIPKNEKRLTVELK
ncbi:MAG TPA: hypothetical protein VJB56_02120 [Candidatus Paceibacterota bacterium]